MDESRINYILGNAKKSMEIEGFTIDDELEAVGRGLLTGEISITDYKEIIRQDALRYAHEV